jgi:hypothetical protein
MSECFVESPARALRRELGLPPRSANRPRVSDWLGLNCGDRVYCHDDPRHVGRVEAIHHGAYALVKWDDSNWREEVALGLLALAGETR